MAARCDYCHQPIGEGVHPFTLKLELYPAVEPSLQVSQKELETDLAAEMERLVQMMSEMNEDEVLRQEKLMHVAHRFTLCPACRDKIARQLERLCPPPM